MKNKSVKLPFETNKQKYLVTFTYNKNKKLDWLFIVHVDPIWLVWHTYISPSLPLNKLYISEDSLLNIA